MGVPIQSEKSIEWNGLTLRDPNVRVDNKLMTPTTPDKPVGGLGATVQFGSLPPSFPPPRFLSGFMRRRHDAVRRDKVIACAIGSLTALSCGLVGFALWGRSLRSLRKAVSV